tara:strand:- start:57 stop:1469 length:1413 start_codon:yes stop_codon:yes gene_type:complete
MSKDFKLIMENWRKYSSEQHVQETEILQEGAADDFKKLYLAQNNGVMDLLNEYSIHMTEEQKSDIRDKNKMWLEMAREIDLSLNDSFETFWKDLEAMLPKDKADAPLAAESKKLNEQDDFDDKTDPDARPLPEDSKEKLEELKSILPQLGEHNEALIKNVSQLEEIVSSGDFSSGDIREQAGRVAQIIFNISKNERKVNTIYELRLRAMYLLIGATGVELASLISDQKAWVKTFLTNVYTQYSAGYRAWVGALDKHAKSFYDKIWSEGGQQLVKEITEYASLQSAEAPGILTRMKWNVISRAIENNKESLLAKAQEGVEPLKRYIEAEPILKRFVEDLAIAKNISKLDPAPTGAYETFIRGLESLWAYIVNAGPTAQIYFWTTITMAITGIIYNWYTKDPQNPVSMAYMSLTQSLKKDLKRLAGAIGSVAEKIKGWVASKKELKSGDKKEIEESIQKLKIILDKTAKGVI